MRKESIVQSIVTIVISVLLSVTLSLWAVSIQVSPRESDLSPEGIALTTQVTELQTRLREYERTNAAIFKKILERLGECQTACGAGGGVEHLIPDHQQPAER